jgi:hypothetical protein
VVDLILKEVLKRVSGYEKEDVTEATENCVMGNFRIYILNEILTG